MDTTPPQNMQAEVLNTLDALVVVLDQQGRIVQFNRACEESTGYSFAEVKGKVIWDFLLIPEEIEGVKTTFANLKTQNDTSQHETIWVSKTGQRRLIAWSNTTLTHPQDHGKYIIGTGTDITERRQSELALKQQVRYEQLWSEIASHIRESLNLNDILNTTVTEVRQVLETDRVLIFRFEPDWSGKVLVESLGPGPWFSAFDMHIRDSCFAQSYVHRYRTGRIKAIEDIQNSNLTPCYVEFLEQFQVRANLVVPILQGDQLWGLLTAHHCSGPRQWQPQDITLLTRLATQLAIALQQAELYQQLQIELVEREQVEVVLQEARKDLEQRVTERTTELITVNQQLNLELQERKEAETALQISQDRFAGILEIAEDAIISINTDQNITLFNQGAERIFGYTAADILGQPLDVLLPSQSTQHHRQHIQTFGQAAQYAREMGERREVYGRRQDGCEFPAEASISKLELESETIYTVILRDISQRKQAQKELEQLSHQNELILNAIGEGLCGLNSKGQFTFVNAAAEQYLGYTATELIEQPIELLLPDIHEGDDFSPIYASLHTGIIQTLQNATFCRKNQSCFPVEYLTTPILERGQVVGAVITFKDISDRQIMERIKDEFISVVSHELRTPLTSIHGSLRMLASGMLSAQPDKSQRLLKIAAESTDRLVRLINDILDVERIESGQTRMTSQACDATELMIQATNTMQGMANKMEVTLSVHPIAAQLWADPDRIEQTFTNLLSNAIKFSAAGSTVWLRATETQSAGSDVICFSIQDQGRGIPADKIDVVFERFQQADSSDTRNHEGTGLGLAICRSIVHQHGGEIWVESQLGEGSTFYFTIPKPSLSSVPVSE
ncbi:MAG: PAS domain S-box protein [Thermosynechococcaceae cyanobacterium]